MQKLDTFFVWSLQMCFSHLQQVVDVLLSFFGGQKLHRLLFCCFMVESWLGPGSHLCTALTNAAEASACGSFCRTPLGRISPGPVGHSAFLLPWCLSLKWQLMSTFIMLWPPLLHSQPKQNQMCYFVHYCLLKAPCDPWVMCLDILFVY